ncbi:MAG: M23 family metallopeptidase [Acidimicrobiia bacterium]|nr:M23 family metallopeptidase [Acidimicrobiia bacterium]MDH5423109.1 M23 family metallopeptidase [Acidimicrobiia bacterium]MDH5504689.1 M23 family metallopeptidase [Acidimicrobiia bacterium]
MPRFVMFCVLLLLGFSPLPAGSESPTCVGMTWPVSGEVIAHYAPSGQYAGHWGIDIGTDAGSVVRAAAPGRVTFAGEVAGNRTVTIDHGGGLRTSYSYLDERLVSAGAWMEAGDPVGRSGLPHAIAGLHFSVRVHGAYVDPISWLGCQPYEPARALRLVG